MEEANNQSLLNNTINSKNSFFASLIKKKYWPAILVLFITLLAYICYIAFALWQVKPDYELYQPELIGSNDIAWLFVDAHEYVVSLWINWPIQIAMIILIAVVAIFIVILSIRHKLTWNRLALALLIIGIIIRFGYGLYNDDITTRNYDTYYYDNYIGHYGITMYIYRNFALPAPIEVSPGIYDYSISYQMYQPKLAHCIYALYMHFNSLFFGNNEWVLYQSIRILNIVISVSLMLIIYKIILELDLSNRAKIIMLIITIFCPMFFRLTGQSNNDLLSTFFMFLGIYFLIKWYKRHSFINIIMIAISIGLGMACKMSVAILALPTALTFLYVLIKHLRKKDISTNNKSLILQFVVFAVIVFPLGLFFPLYSNIKYGEPLLYVLYPKDPTAAIESNINIFNRIGYFSFYQYFHTPYMQLNGDGRDFNVWASVLKSPLFGEFTYQDSNIVFAWIMLISQFILSLYFVAFAILIIVKSIANNIRAHKTKQHYQYQNATIFMAFLFVLFITSYIIFSLQYPFTFSMDFRYAVPLVLPFGYFIAKGYDTIATTIKKPLIQKSIFIPLCSVLALFMLSTISMYILIA